MIGTASCENLFAYSGYQYHRVKRIEISGAVTISDETYDCRALALNFYVLVLVGCNAHRICNGKGVFLTTKKLIPARKLKTQ
jgi:hypothetical protein